jgi:hypothetical protein
MPSTRTVFPLYSFGAARIASIDVLSVSFTPAPNVSPFGCADVLAPAPDGVLAATALAGSDLFAELLLQATRAATTITKRQARDMSATLRRGLLGVNGQLRAHARQGPFPELRGPRV